MPPASPRAPSSSRGPLRRAADVLRADIERATAEGFGAEDMLLRLTYGDTSELKRDRLLAVEDISFAGGVMRFLGVKVAPGGVTVSRLDCGEAARS